MKKRQGSEFKKKFCLIAEIVITCTYFDHFRRALITLCEEVLSIFIKMRKRFDQLYQNKFHRKSSGNLNSVLDGKKFVNFCIFLSESIPLFWLGNSVSFHLRSKTDIFQK